MKSIAAVLGTAIALAGAGCGGGGAEGDQPLSKDEYTRELVRIYGGSGKADLLYNDLVYERAAPARCEQTIRSFEDTVRRAIDDLEAIEPPADARTAHDQLVAGATQALAEVEPLVAPVAAGSVRCGLPLQNRLGGISTASADRAVSELRELGYVPFD